ncbi:MAG: LLM class flavin-dependent oxidoreductase [bacterium]|nr:LLM class flavin-dependent oxidoreductase [bacterium]
MSVLNLGRYAPARLRQLARLQEACGYETFWFADERFFREVYASLTFVAGQTQKIQLGTMVTDPYSRHPAMTAMAIATLDEISAGRAVLGLGAGVSGFSEMQVARRKPAMAMREMVTVVNDLLRGATVDFQGEVICFDHGRLDFQPLRSHIPTYIASNGPMGLALAGEVAQGAVMQGASADGLVDWLLAQVGRGAQRASRERSEIDLVARLNLCLHDDAKIAKDVMRPTVVRSLVAQHPNYRTYKTAGLELPSRLAQMIASMGYTHDPQLLAPAAALVPDTFVDATTLAGTIEEVAHNVVRMAQRGVNHIMVSPIAPDGDVESILTRFARDVMPRVTTQLNAE